MYVARVDEVFDLYVLDLMSKRISKLTESNARNESPTWSPDGRHVVFLSNRDGGWKVWIMSEDGRYQFPITDAAGGYATPDWGR